MSKLAVEVREIGKQYFIGIQQQNTNQRFGEALTHTLLGPLRRARKLLQGQATGAAELDEAFWALRDISFDVKTGETVGIIGRNGAGKSTLLKILSRITSPTTGTANLYGRIGSLLEVGTGFHQELTGRENIHLNGAILGMSQAEIRHKFDEIISFAEVERFIDTPVKHYSSGMLLRLGFAVAAHLEPEILVVDEVLAVGDIAFQKKCLGKMEDVAGTGRTVLFVSHNMAAVQSLCSRGILLENGQISFAGSVDDTISTYIHSVQKMIDEQTLEERTDRTDGEHFRFKNVEFLDADTGLPVYTLVSGQNILVRMEYVCDDPDGIRNVVPSIAFSRIGGGFLFACRSDVVGHTYDIEPGYGTIICRIPKWPLNTGRYTYSVIAWKHDSIIDWVRDAGSVDTQVGDFYGTGRVPASTHQGVFTDYSYENKIIPISD